MKLAYERPMMHAEMFQTQEYCAKACSDLSQGETHMNRVTMKDGIWYNVPNGAAENVLDGGKYTGETDEYLNLTFGGGRVSMTGSNNKTQFYWYTDVNNQRYYLEYSAGWTDKYHENGGNANDMVFVLYEEDYANDMEQWGNQYGDRNDFNKDGQLNAAVGNRDYYPGSTNDDDNYTWPNYNNVTFQDYKWDNSIFAAIFSSVGTYWS